MRKDTEETQKIVTGLSALVDKTSKGQPIKLSKALKVFYGALHPLYFKNASAGFYKNYDDVKNCIEEVFEKVTATPGMMFQVNT